MTKEQQKIVETAIAKQTYLVDDLRFTVHELNDLIERLLATQDTGGGGELIEPNTCTCVQCDSWRRYAHALATRSQDTGEREIDEICLSIWPYYVHPIESDMGVSDLMYRAVLKAKGGKV